MLAPGALIVIDRTDTASFEFTHPPGTNTEAQKLDSLTGAGPLWVDEAVKRRLRKAANPRPQRT